MISKYLKGFLALSLCIIFLQPALSLAKDRAEKDSKKQSEAEKPVVYEGNYNLIESYGIYTKPKEGSLGRDLWSNSARSAIGYWIKESPNEIRNPIIQRLIFGALLSKVNPRLIQNDIPITPGEDLFTLRIEKLVKMGAYTQASDLYSLAGEEPYHPRLAYSGILAMLSAGNKSTACLEAKTSLEKFTKNKKLQEISDYCDLGSNKEAYKAARKALKKSKYAVLKSIAKNKKYKQSYSVGKFSGFAPLELAVLIADKRITLGKVEADKIPPQHLGFLLHIKDLSAFQNFTLSEKAVYWGLLKPDVLDSLYDEAEIPEDKIPAWLQIPASFRTMQKAAKGEEKWTALSEAFVLGRKRGVHLLAPFAKDIRNANPKEASLLDIHTALSVLLYTGEEIRPDWFKLIEKAKAENKSQYNSLLTALYVSTPHYKRKKAIKKAIGSIITKQNQPTSPYYSINILATILDISRAAGAKKTSDISIYEKRFPLTSPSDYVMPNYQVWDRLNDASRKGGIGETILLSSNILRIYEPNGFSGDNAGKIYPGLLRDLLKSLDNVGLTNVSRDLAIQVTLGQK